MSKQKQPTALAVAQEAAILTVAVAIIAAAVYFSWCQAMRRSAAFRVWASCCPTLCRCRCLPSR